ncbi:TPA: hypothetical protein ACX6PR_003056 [Photobacterium damselae]
MKFLIKTVIPFIFIGMYIPEVFFFIFFMAAVFLIIKYFQSRNRDYTLVQGSVVAIKENISKDMDGKKVHYAPVFAYDYEGKSYIVEHPVNINVQGRSLFTVGQKVDLRVYQDAPDQAMLNSHFTTHILLYAGLGFFIVPGIIMAAFIKGGLVNFYTLGDRIQAIFVFIYNIIEKLISFF